MSLIDKVRNAVGMGKEEYVVQVYNPEGRYWVDEGGSDEVSEPEEYGFADTDTEKRRKVLIKGDKVVQIDWVIGGKKKRTRKTKELTSDKRSPVDAISMQAQKIKKDQEKMIELKDVLSDLLGDSAPSTKKEEWMYPGMFSGMNRGLGAGFMTAFENDSGELRSAALGMVGGISNLMAVVPVIAVTIAKSQGVNVGMFGIDDNGVSVNGNGASAPVPSPPANNAPDIIHEHDGGFDVNTTDEELDEVDLVTEEESVKPKPIPGDLDEEIVFDCDWEEGELGDETPVVGDEQ